MDHCVAELTAFLREHRASVAVTGFTLTAYLSTRLAGILPTTGHMVVFGMLTHESNHLGQLAVWRSAAGMVPALSKMS